MTKRFAIAIATLNLAIILLGVAAPFGCGTQMQHVDADPGLGILRGRGLEIVDDAGRVRASITLFPATADYPETALFRLIDTNGRPSVKIEASDRNGGLSVCAATGTSCAIFEPSGVRVLP